MKFSSGVLLLFTACCFGGVTERPLQSGTYVLENGPDGFGAATLAVDASAKSARLSSADGGSQTLTLESRPKSEWLDDCYTQTSHSLSELHRITPNPLAIGSRTFTDPVLSSKCGGRLMLGTLENGRLPESGTLLFRPAP